MARWAVRVPAHTYRQSGGEGAEKESGGRGVGLIEDSKRRQLRHDGERPSRSVSATWHPASSSEPPRAAAAALR